MADPVKANEAYVYCMNNFNTVGKHFCVPIIINNYLDDYGTLNIDKQVPRKIDGVNLAEILQGKHPDIEKELLVMGRDDQTLLSKKFDEFIKAAKAFGINIKDSLHVNIMFDKKEKCFVLIDFDTAYFTDDKSLSRELSSLKDQAVRLLQKKDSNLAKIYQYNSPKPH